MPLPNSPAGAIWLLWAAQDNTGGSGVKDFDLEWSQTGANPQAPLGQDGWIALLNASTETRYPFAPINYGVTYYFRLRSRDNANNVSGWSFVDKQIPAQGSGSAPVPDFSFSPQNPVAGQSVQFTDASTNSPTSWAWDFQNNGSTDSTQQNPSFTYSAAGTYTVKLTVTNQYGSNSITKQVVVSPSGGGSEPTITISPTNVNSGTVNQAYNQTTAFSASGGTAPYSYAHISGSLPSGMSFNPSTRKFEGTTAQTGTFSGLVIRATDANGFTGQRSYTLVIYSSGGGGTSDIIIYVFEDGVACSDEAGVIYRV